MCACVFILSPKVEHAELRAPSSTPTPKTNLDHGLSFPSPETLGDTKGIPKNFCDKDFAELSGELSDAIRLKTLVLLGNDRYDR